MWTRAICGWTGILLVAIVSGGFRDRFIRPRFGPFGAEVFGAAVLSVAIQVAALWVIPRWETSPGWLSLLWLSMTVSFEFLFFHYVGKHSWNELLAAYRIWEGRLWIVVLLALIVAPFIAEKLLQAPR